MVKKTEERQKREEKTYTPTQMVNGVMNTLYKRGFDKESSNKTIYSYIAHIGMDKDMSLENACMEIQKDFDSFIRFVREQSSKELTSVPLEHSN